MLDYGWKRLLSGLLALVLVVGMLPPVAVRAEEGETTPVTQATEAIETTEVTETEETVETTEATETNEPSETEETTEVNEAEEIEPTETVETEPDETEAEKTLPEETREEIELYSETGIVDSGTCGENLTWTLDEEGTLTICGTGDMTDYRWNSDVPWYSHRKKIFSVVIEEGVTSICNSAFYDCSSLSSITIPESVTTIGKSVFYSCESLTALTIPKAVTSMGVELVSGCTNLTSITVDSGNTAYHSEGNCIIHTESKTLLAGCSTSVIPTDGSVTCIGAWAFSHQLKLENISIPEGVTSIETGAFCVCPSLASINIPESVTSIGQYAFSNCSSASSLTIPEGVTSIGKDAFSQCRSLTSITIPKSVTSIGDAAFAMCWGLTSITVASRNTVYHSAGNCLIHTESKTLVAGCSASVLPDDGSVTSIGTYAFRDCRNLTSLTIPEGVTSIGRYAFSDCDNLTSVTIPESMTSIEWYAFGYCNQLENVYYGGSKEDWQNITINRNGNSALTEATLYTVEMRGTCGANLTFTLDTAGNLKIFGTGNMTDYSLQNMAPWHSYAGTISGVTLSQEITGIGDYAFYGCASLPAVALPEQLTRIGSYAFYGCKNLSRVTIPEQVTAIGDSAFYGCTDLTLLVLPEQLTRIGSYAFYDCDSLTDVYYAGSKSQWYNISIGAYNNPLRNASLHFATILSQGRCGKDLTWMLTSDGTLTISGTGAMYDYTRNGNIISEDSPFVNLEISQLVFKEGITHIGDCAFISCTGDWGTVVLPESLESIGDEAFHRCTALTGTLVIPQNVREISEEPRWYTNGSFGGNRLTSFSVAEGNQYFTTIDGILYSKDLTRLLACPGQKTGSVTFPTNLKRIDASAFFGCDQLTGDLIFPEGLQTIGMWCFFNCTGLDGKICFPESLVAIYPMAFASCSGLTGTVKLPSGVYVGHEAFIFCSGLTGVIIPDGITVISPRTFLGCTNLSRAVISEGVTTIDSSAFCAPV